MPATILIIEDERQQAQDLIEHLKYRGHEVLPVAYNGNDGIDRAIQYRPQIVIVDLRLQARGGDKDGYAVIRAIRSAPETHLVGIIALTRHYTSPDDEVKALRSGADSYSRKGDPYVVEARIEAMVNRINQSWPNIA